LGWALGSSIVVLPWCARNLILFGSIHPYDATPSPLSGCDSNCINYSTPATVLAHSVERAKKSIDFLYRLYTYR
jgi:hypothetical protein